MLSRISKTLYRSSPSSPTLPLLSSPFRNLNSLHPLSRPSYSTQTPNQQHFTEAQKQVDTIINNLLNNKSAKGQDLVLAFEELEKNKIGIISNTDIFKTFVNKSQEILRTAASGAEVQIITKKAWYLNIKDPLFWFSIDNLVKHTDVQLSFNHFLVISSILIRNKSYMPFEHYFRETSKDLQDTIKQNMKMISLSQLVHANFLYAYIGSSFPELHENLKARLDITEANLKTNLSPNDIATSALLVSSLFDKNDKTRKDIMKQLTGSFLNRKLDEYDINMDKTDHMLKNKFKVPVKERLTWESVGQVSTVFTSEEFRDVNGVKRVLELIEKKSENDLVDFDSAALILTNFVGNKVDVSNDVYTKILDSVYWQLEKEGTAIYTQFDGRNIVYFLNSLRELKKKGVNGELLKELFDYFGGVLLEKAVGSRIEKGDYKALLKVFEGSQKEFGHPREILEFLKVNQPKEEVRKRDDGW